LSFNRKVYSAAWDLYGKLFCERDG